MAALERDPSLESEFAAEIIPRQGTEQPGKTEGPFEDALWDTATARPGEAIGQQGNGISSPGGVGSKSVPRGESVWAGPPRGNASSEELWEFRVSRIGRGR